MATTPKTPAVQPIGKPNADQLKFFNQYGANREAGKGQTADRDAYYGSLATKYGLKQTQAKPTGGALPSLTPLGGPPAAAAAPAYNAPEAFKFDYNYLNFDTAKQRAEERYNPLFEQSVSNVRGEEAQNKLNAGEQSANRGLAHSGLAQDQLTKISIATQGQIAGLNAQKNANVMDYSQNLLDKDLDRGDRLRSQMYNEYSDSRNFGYNQYRDQVGDSQWNTSRNDSNYWNQKGQDNVDRDFNRGVFESDRGFDRGVLESDRGYGLEKSRFNEDVRQNNLNESWRNKEWSQMSPAEKSRMALEQSYAMKLKKASGGGGGDSGNYAGVTEKPVGDLPPTREEIMRILQGNNYSKITNYGRQYGTTSRATQSPENKKSHPLLY